MPLLGRRETNELDPTKRLIVPVFDVTRVVTHTESIWDRSDRRFKNIRAMVDWLSTNVGKYYGPGNDRNREPSDEDLSFRGNAVLHRGSGWQIERKWQGDRNGYVEVWWYVDIANDADATLFALKWIK